ncbi:MAG TPA: AMP-binding protein, partial [Brevibacillus sp.]|nr:AMP-binding protein [Brevibacillus sp.]
MYHLDKNLKISAEKFPQQPAYVFHDVSTTYAELDRQVDLIAAGLAERGIGKGDAVALLMDNRPEFIQAYYAILRVGAAVVPMNPSY